MNIYILGLMRYIFIYAQIWLPLLSSFIAPFLNIFVGIESVIVYIYCSFGSEGSKSSFGQNSLTPHWGFATRSAVPPWGTSQATWHKSLRKGNAGILKSIEFQHPGITSIIYGSQNPTSINYGSFSLPGSKRKS